jgi:hypothetical protein
MLAGGGVWTPRSRALRVEEQQQLVINEEMLRAAKRHRVSQETTFHL